MEVHLRGKREFNACRNQSYVMAPAVYCETKEVKNVEMRMKLKK